MNFWQALRRAYSALIFNSSPSKAVANNKSPNSSSIFALLSSSHAVFNSEISSYIFFEKNYSQALLFELYRHVRIGLCIEFSRVAMTRVDRGGNNGRRVAIADSPQRMERGLRFTFHALLQGLVQLVSGAARGHHDECVGFD